MLGQKMKANKLKRVFSCKVIFLISLLLSYTVCFADFKTRLPILDLKTNKNEKIGNKKVKGVLIIKDDALMGVNSISDRAPLDNQYKIDIKIRGNSSRLYSKKQYGITLLNKVHPQLLEEDDYLEDGELKSSLLGMPSSSEWVLNGPYTDRSLMKNALAYQIGGLMFKWTPKTRYIELYINSKYHGVYLLIEKIKRDKNKVDIKNSKNGGFIGKVDGGKSPFMALNSGTKVTLVYPKTNEKKGELVKAKRILDQFEKAIVSNDQEVLALIDEKSFIDYLLIQELWKNIDGFRRSMFFHIKKDGKIAMGPIWDFDIAAGGLSIFYDTHKIEGWHHRKINYRDGAGDAVIWFKQLLKNPKFKKKVVARWSELRSEGRAFDFKIIDSFIEHNKNQLKDGPAERNFKKWKILGKVTFPLFWFTSFPLYKDWNSEINRLRNFLIKRMSWMDKNIQTI